MRDAAGSPYLFDTELAAALPQLPVIDLRDLEVARRERAARTAAAPQPSLEGLDVQDLVICAPDGTDVGVRLYRPTGPVRAGLLHVHGGGFVLGDVAMDHPRCAALSRDLGVAVVSVDYALAPEHPYPRPVDDTWHAWCWLVDQARVLGLDPGRLALHGVSAGAALATAVALRSRQLPGYRPAFVYLASPVLDDRLATPSMTAFDDTPMWTRANAVLSWAAYLGDGVAGTDTVPVDAAPGRATDLSGLPPAYLAVMEFDPLRDEALAFAAALVRDGVPVEAHLFPGTFHTSAGAVPAAGVSRRQLDEELAVLRAALLA